METIDILKAGVKALDDKKALDIKVIKVDDVTILTDYFVVATGASTTQVKALANEIDFKLSQAGISAHHVEGKSSGWILLDYNSVIFHVFYKNDRAFYSIERLWQDGQLMDIDKLLS